MDKIYKIIFCLVLALLLAVAIYLFIQSYISGMVFLLLLAAAALSVRIARPVIWVKVKAEMKNKKGPNLLNPSAIEIALDAENSYQNRIRFSEFMDQQGVIFYDANGNEQIEFDQNIDIFVNVSKGALFGYCCKIDNDNYNDPVTDHINFRVSPVARNNKLIVFLLFSLSIIMTVTFCLNKNNQYQKSRKQIEMNLSTNLDAICSNEDRIQLMEEDAETLYYEELPKVHLLVIKKDDNIFINKESEFCNPNIVNTVLMLYEDNLSGNLFKEDEGTEETTEAASKTTYYNVTELYLNLPIMTEDKKVHMIGELLEGTVEYAGMTGYSALQAWFRDIYHIRIASVTELPEHVISACWVKDVPLAVSLNTDLTRFIRDYYCIDIDNRSGSHLVRPMLVESKPFYSERIKDRVEKMAGSMGLIGHEKNKIYLRSMTLQMSGSEAAAFGNSVRDSAAGQTEYDFLLEENYYANTESHSLLLEHQEALGNIVHSNWDILMTDILDSISQMNNGTYQLLCEENHQDLLQAIRTSDPEGLNSFLDALCHSNTIINDKPSTAYVFYVRNLDLKLFTRVGQTNSYLLNQPLAVRPYTNRQIKKSLYYCLREPKGGSDG